MTEPQFLGSGPLAQRLNALQAIIDFADQSQAGWSQVTAVDYIVGLTTKRTLTTAKAISNLLVDRGVSPAMMLCRSLFEDMAVVHWLLMQDDPTFLVQRFFDHSDRSVIKDHDHFVKHMGEAADRNLRRPGVAEALERRDKLGAVGTSKDPNWWGGWLDDGTPKGGLGLAQIVERIERAPRYASRFQGDGGFMLQNAFGLATRWANENLHHTPRGLPSLLRRDGHIWVPDALTNAMGATWTAYWTLGQTVYAQLSYVVSEHDLGPAQAFHELFISRIPDAMNLSEVDLRTSLAQIRAEEATIADSQFSGASREQPV